MRLAFCADPHIGNHRRFGGPTIAGINTRCRLALKTLGNAVAAAQEAKCEALVVLGDLFDTSRPEPQIIAAVQDVVKDMPLIVLLGNHDQVSAEPGDHALGPLSPVAFIVETPQILSMGAVELWTIPFRPGRAVDWLPQVMAEVQGDSRSGGQPPPVRVLALHLGLQDDSTAPWLKDSHDSVPVALVEQLMAQHKIVLTFAGNWHDQKQWETPHGIITQVGTLCPTGWDNPGLKGYGGLAVLDTEPSPARGPWVPAVSLKEIAGPRFVTLRSVSGPWSSREANQVFVKLIAPPDFMDTAGKWLQAEKDARRIFDGEVEPEGTEERVAAITAAQTARSALTLEEAIAGFVSEMPLPEGVKRDAVLARVKQYLGGAA